MRKISSNKYKVLKEEIDYYKENNLISQDQYKNILNLYSIKKGLNFIAILLILGATLVGLGVLTFVASNWIYLSKVAKFTIIVISFTTFNLSSYKLYYSYPKTSKSFMYIAMITFGAGIFLIGQMFNFGGDFTTALLFWSLGILPYAVFFKEKYVFVFSNILVITFINEHFISKDILLALIIIVPLFYIISSHFNFDKLVLFVNNLVTINALMFICNNYIDNSTISILLFFIVGIMLYYRPIKIQEFVFKLQGNLVYGISGFMLTFPSNWEGISFLSSYGTKFVSVFFTIGFIVYLLFQTRNKNLLSLIIIFLIIMRYYFDSLYEFMPKSLFFIIGGVILLAFGYYFERFRNESRGEKNG